MSSSKANILGADILGPLVLEALNAFFLVINSLGNVNFVSEVCITNATFLLAPFFSSIESV